MKKRRKFDYKKFDLNSESKNIMLQLFHGIEEIKLHNVEREKRWEWEYMQARKYKLGMNILAWGQIQSSGSMLINTLKNVFISFISAKAVIDGEMSLGMMMSVQFIIGQLQYLNIPEIFLNFNCFYGRNAQLGLNYILKKQ